jgi:crotonobetainyl-CoA:carnitine CoA-transferase CaiB-like acyl-CoA transferase
MNSNARALEGIRVLDITQVMAGPFCAMQLCDMGADVIKVEPPEGDATRRWGTSTGDESAAFNAMNRGKRSIVLDLKRDDGRQIARRLADRADIFIENYRPVMKGFGLDYRPLATTA